MGQREKLENPQPPIRVEEILVPGVDDLSPEMVQETLRTYNTNVHQYATEVYHPQFRAEAQRLVINVFLEHLPKDSDPSQLHILVAGVGAGGDAGDLLERGYNVVGIDILEAMVHAAALRLHAIWRKVRDEGQVPAHFYVRNLSMEEAIQYLPHESFDGILCNSALPNLPYEHAVRFIQNSYNLLTPGGVIQLAFKLSEQPEGHREVVYIPYGEGRRYSLAFTKHGAQTICELAGLEIKEMITQPHIVDGSHRRNWLVIIAQKPK